MDTSVGTDSLQKYYDSCKATYNQTQHSLIHSQQSAEMFYLGIFFSLQTVRSVVRD